MDTPVFVEYLLILRRWRNLFVAVTGAMIAGAMVLALGWSNYRAMATIGIEQQEISADTTVPSNVNPGDLPEALADLRIGQIQQRVLAPQMLAEIIKTFQLYPAAMRTTPIMALAETMRKKVKINLISGTVANPAAAGRLSPGQLSAIAFTLSFDYTDPKLTRQVTDELVRRFMEEDVQERHDKARETSEFLGKQIAVMETALAGQEKQIADFQKAHGGNTPESLRFYQQNVAAATQNLQNIDSQIITNEGMQGALRSQIAATDPYTRVVGDNMVLTTPTMQLRALRTQYAALTSRYGSEHPDVLKLKRQIEGMQAEPGGFGATPQLAAQIADTKARLAAAVSGHGADHPDTQALQRQLAGLESQQRVQPRRGLGLGVRGDADNPAYVELVAQLRAAEQQHKGLLAQRAAVEQERAQSQKTIVDNPGLEQQMAALSRDYDNAKLRYRALKDKKMVADMNQQLERDSKGQRLVLINPAQMPLHTSPSRLLILLGGVIVALLGGIASVTVAQISTQSVVGMRGLTQIVGVEPLVAVPHILDAREAVQMQRLGFLTNRAVVLALAVTGVMVIYALLLMLHRS